ncbi:uncharacterized protein TRUGW13939_10395 [Talaromyces rugulosus]|uniref:Major facilitator superfamily (MFS) profile domain-containing protein n=1 Tax=Talaromyces rugulosus TaxID=121627 RepID=A0A7H8RA84_TALRU|nr:uncharacterized protein TRUGW13939_10395 [Talaromyces rugulosus]QKX63226.1 hypothetical protein TRUGW13939_10395 [Talaromyces rugulosus]
MATASNSSVNGYTWACGLFAAVGSLLYGIDSGIVSTVISQPDFLNYFAPFTPSIKGAVVSINTLSCELKSLLTEIQGRKKTIAIGAVIALIAGILQAASVKIGMLIAGRIVGGFAVGIMS